ncbi:hypothetical protein BDV59DRAFT_203570 [Aspergillus ambiguus]|uniref:uncharacterized protein n=1 Tax=Aspergillus ambiguus TaxID=176160 RepID=UPI003CCCB6BD
MASTNTNSPTTPRRQHYDLSTNPDFNGSVLVVERDPSFSATKASNNCMRQQFATAINTQIAQYAADFVKRIGAEFPADKRIPNPPICSFRYL